MSFSSAKTWTNSNSWFYSGNILKAQFKCLTYIRQNVKVIEGVPWPKPSNIYTFIFDVSQLPNHSSLIELSFSFHKPCTVLRNIVWPIRILSLHSSACSHSSVPFLHPSLSHLMSCILSTSFKNCHFFISIAVSFF